MSDNSENPTTSHSEPRAVIRPVRGISRIWLVPIVAVLMGAWMVYYNWSRQGPLITIEFVTAAGIEAGKTKIKALSIDIGEVESLALNDGADGVVVTARLAQNAVGLLREDTRFWVVSPQISSAGISGLNTLLSGPYIELSPGSGAVTRQYAFKGLENAPLTPAGAPGLHVTLDSNANFTFNAGDPILYRGYKVGKIEDVYFNTEERTVYYNAFIEAPYQQLITTNTRFWKMSGVEVDFSADGVNVQTGTLETLISGGVAFDIPEDFPLGERITERAFFKIYPNYEAIFDQRYRHSLKYILLVGDSIRGLKVGAPVEFRGVKIGHVTRTDIGYATTTNVLDRASRIPVMISLEPGRMGLGDTEEALAQAQSDIERWIGQGLRASLKSGNLLTGSQLVELQYFDIAEAPAVERFADFAVIPTAPNDLAQISANISDLVRKINQLPLDAVTDSTNKFLLEGTQTLAELGQLAGSIDQIMTTTRKEQIPENLNAALEEVRVLARDFSQGSPTYDELRYTLESLNGVLHELKPLLTHLKNRPNGLLFGGQRETYPEPRGSDQ